MLAAGEPTTPAAGPIEPPDVWNERVVVTLEYPVVFTERVLEPSNTALAWTLARREPDRRHRALVVLDAGLVQAWPSLPHQLRAYASAWSERLEWVGEPVVLPGGEAAKEEPESIARLHARIYAEHLDRHAYVVAFGGGAVLDAAGYAAATAHRGLRLVRLPSTVLAQNDAGIGVKNGINAFGTKNFLGTFAPPWAVIDDRAWLSTLAPRDRIAGIAEAIKVALIRDGAFFEWLEAHASALAAGDDEATWTMIRRCAELHLDHIRAGGDPFETGSARPLDFGHWAAHKLESMTRHALRHGEAVAIGIAIDTRYSVLAGRLAPESAARVDALVDAIGLPRWDAALAELDARGRPVVLAGIDEFREHLGGELTVTMLAAIGRGVEVHAIDEGAMLRVLRELAP